MQLLLQILLNGIGVGAIYALIALGYTMVYGVLKLINFAHGDVFMIGAMVGWYVARWTGESRDRPTGGGLPITLAPRGAAPARGFLLRRRGTGMRAVSYNSTVASLMGVNIDLVISFTFVLGSVLAAVAGILYASKYPSVQPLMGLMPGLKAFVAAVLGGIGNVPGAMLGGLV